MDANSISLSSHIGPPLDWPFWGDFLTKGVVFHVKLGNAKSQAKKGVFSLLMNVDFLTDKKL